MGEDLDISKLLQMRRMEPSADDTRKFLHEFHRRQRAKMLRPSVREALWDRLMSIAPTFRVPQFAYAAIFAIAVSVSTVILTQQPGATGNQIAAAAPEATQAPISLVSTKPVTIGDAVPVSARTDGSLPSHYVLQPRPVSNEQPLSF